MTYKFQRRISSRTAEIITPDGRTIRLPYSGDLPPINSIVHPRLNNCCCPIELSFDNNQKSQFTNRGPRRNKRKRAPVPNDLAKTMILLDVSGSYAGPSRAIVKDLKKLYNTFKHSTIATFVDKPLDPFARIGDWVFKVEINGKLTEQQYLSALENFSFGRGQDDPECQFEALLNAVIRFGKRYKYVLIITDNPSHLPGDNSNYRPHDHKTIVGPNYDGTHLDYPDPYIVLDMAKRVNLIPVFNEDWFLPYVIKSQWGYIREIPVTTDGLIKAGTTKYNPKSYGLYEK